MAKLDQQIEALEKRLKQAKERRRMIEARKRAAESADDTRRKILIGAVILGKVDRGEWTQDQVREMMAASLTREDDRALFGLDPLPSKD